MRRLKAIHFIHLVFILVLLQPLSALAWVEGEEDSFQYLRNNPDTVTNDYMEEDSGTSSSLPDNNWGDSSFTFVGESNHGTDLFMYAYLQGYSCPVGAISSSYMMVYIQENYMAGHNVRCAAPNSSWSESTITWNNQPDMIAGTTDLTVMSAGMGAYQSIDCSLAVTYGCAHVNNGFMLYYTGPTMDKYFTFYTSEYTGSTRDPYLAITLSVDLADFFAVGISGGIRLYWATSQEVDNAGWNIYRATKKGGPYEKLNNDMIPAYQYDYEYFDTTAESGSGYYYKVEDVELSGQATLHGPVFGITWEGEGAEDGSVPDDTGFNTNQAGAENDNSEGGCGG